MFKILTKLFKNKKKKIYVLRLDGVIGMSRGGLRKGSGLNFDSIRKDVDKAFKDRATKAVVLQINSPGGSPGQSEMIARYIKALSETHNIPVFSFVEDVAASGGYWLACIGEEIYALDTSILGSIGVLSAGFGFVDLMKKIGIQRRVITQGKNKMVWDPFSDEKASDKKIIESIQKDTYKIFQTLVSQRRGKRIKISEEKLFSGEFWSGMTAKSYGLIDGIGDYYTVMREKYGKNVDFIFLEKKGSMLGKMLGISSHSDIVDHVIEKIEEKIAFIRFRLW